MIYFISSLYDLFAFAEQIMSKVFNNNNNENVPSLLCLFSFLIVYSQTATSRNVTTLIKTIPSSMLSVAKPGGGVTTTQVGTKTIVIAAPKGSTGTLSTPTKIITSVPKLGGQAGNTQFIVVSPQSAASAGNTSKNALLHSLESQYIIFINL